MLSTRFNIETRRGWKFISKPFRRFKSFPQTIYCCWIFRKTPLNGKTKRSSKSGYWDSDGILPSLFTTSKANIQAYISRLLMHDVNSNSLDGKTKSNRKWKINYIKQQQTLLRFNSRIMILLVIIFRLFTSQSLRSFIPFLFCLWMCLMLHFFVLLNAAIHLQGMP